MSSKKWAFITHLPKGKVETWDQVLPWPLCSSSDLDFLLTNRDNFHSTDPSAGFNGVIFKIVEIVSGEKLEAFSIKNVTTQMILRLRFILNLCVPVCKYVHRNAGIERGSQV